VRRPGYEANISLPPSLPTGHLLRATGPEALLTLLASRERHQCTTDNKTKAHTIKSEAALLRYLTVEPSNTAAAWGPRLCPHWLAVCLHFQGRVVSGAREPPVVEKLS